MKRRKPKRRFARHYFRNSSQLACCIVSGTMLGTHICGQVLLACSLLSRGGTQGGGMGSFAFISCPTLLSCMARVHLLFSGGLLRPPPVPEWPVQGKLAQLQELVSAPDRNAADSSRLASKTALAALLPKRAPKAQATVKSKVCRKRAPCQKPKRTVSKTSRKRSSHSCLGKSY